MNTNCPICKDKDPDCPYEPEGVTTKVLKSDVVGSYRDLLLDAQKRVAELEGLLNLSQDEYVKQVGTWKIIQRLEHQVAELEHKLEVMYENHQQACKEAGELTLERDRYREALEYAKDRARGAIEAYYLTMKKEHLGREALVAFDATVESILNATAKETK